jgi:hypothetical protein
MLLAGAHGRAQQTYNHPRHVQTKKPINQRKNKNENCCVIEREISFVSQWMLFFFLFHFISKETQKLNMSKRHFIAFLPSDSSFRHHIESLSDTIPTL